MSNAASRMKRAAWRAKYLSERFQNAATWERYSSIAPSCVLYLKDGRECKTPWLTTEPHVRRALELMKSKYGRAIIYVN